MAMAVRGRLVAALALLATRVAGDCTLGCSGHGVCMDSTCVCDPGWIGIRCGMNQKICNWELCLGRGVCAADNVGFRCRCEPRCGWIGAACSVCDTPDGVCLSPCTYVETNIRATPTPDKAAEPASGDGVAWWLPLVILVPVFFVLIISAILVRSALKLRNEKIQEFDSDDDSEHGGGRDRRRRRKHRRDKDKDRERGGKGGHQQHTHAGTPHAAETAALPSAPPPDVSPRSAAGGNSVQHWRESYAAFKAGPGHTISTGLDLPHAGAPPGYPSPPAPPDFAAGLQPRSPHTPPTAPPIAASFAATLREDSLTQQRSGTSGGGLDLSDSFQIEINDEPPALVPPSRENSGVDAAAVAGEGAGAPGGGMQASAPPSAADKTVGQRSPTIPVLPLGPPPPPPPPPPPNGPALPAHSPRSKGKKVIKKVKKKKPPGPAVDQFRCDEVARRGEPAPPRDASDTSARLQAYLDQ